MTDLPHTPGPWEWVGRDLESNSPGHYAAVIETTVSCGQFCYGGSVNLKVSDADARLIAAAPRLLAALLLLVNEASTGLVGSESITAACAAIAAALGE